MSSRRKSSLLLYFLPVSSDIMGSTFLLLVFSFLLLAMSLSSMLQVEAAAAATKSSSNPNPNPNPNPNNNPQITVMGIVYCDTCSNNSFSRHSYFLPGVEVRIDCKFKAASPRTTEEITFSVNRTTNKYGIYKLEIPSVDGVQCARDKAVGNSCRASLLGIGIASSSCATPGFQTTSDEISIKSKQENMCIYSLNALSYRPSKRNIHLCGAAGK